MSLDVLGDGWEWLAAAEAERVFARKAKGPVPDREREREGLGRLGRKGRRSEGLGPDDGAWHAEK